MGVKIRGDKLNDKLFYAYIPASGKRPTVKITDKSNWLSEPPTTGDYIGILRDGFIQVDIDEMDLADKVEMILKQKRIQCDILQTTRGKHFFLKNTGINTCYTGVFSAIGIPMDLGVGGRNRVIPLRVTSESVRTTIRNGEEVSETIAETVDRQWIQTYDELDDLPCWLRPIDKKDRKFAETKTRNSDLFEYILVLQTKGFTRAEVRATLKIINDHILYEPLPDRELDTITRDDAFSEKIFFGGKNGTTFLHDRFGDYMLSNGNVIRINDKINIYTKDFIYTDRQDDFERAFIEKIPHLKDTQRSEVYKYMHLKCSIDGEYSAPKYIGLKDFILDLENMEQLPYNPKFVIQNKIDFNYNENSYHELLDKTLDKVVQNDENLRLLLEEMIGYTLYRRNTMQKAFILTGAGANGKSTILNIIKKLLGDQNYTAMSIQELEKTFEPAELHNKLANIGDDISAKYLEKSSNFKKAVTGETFLVQQKFGHPFMLQNYSTQIFCANDIPPVNDRSDGFGRRLIIIPFNAKFESTDSDYDPFIEDKLLTRESIEYLLKLAINGLKRVLYNKRFTESEQVKELTEKYLKENNNVLQWLDEEPKIENESVASVYQDYNIWVSTTGTHPLSRINFGKELAKVGWVSDTIYSPVEKKSVRIYLREDESE